MKKTVRLTESELKVLIKETLSEVDSIAPLPAAAHQLLEACYMSVGT